MYQFNQNGVANGCGTTWFPLWTLLKVPV